MKFALLIATSLAATSPMASEQETFGNWMKIKAYDAKTQERSCGVVNIDGSTTGGPTLVFITNHKSQPPHAFAISSGRDKGEKLDYRVDGKQAMSLTIKQQDRSPTLFIKDDEFKQIISDFKSGNKVSITITPIDKTKQTETSTIPLNGFSAAYKASLTCV